MAGRSDQITVLVVDDESDLRALIKTVLELDGRYVVVGEAATGAEGVERAAALQPDVVVLDRSMPAMTGLEALPRIQEVAPGASVILYTAENDQQVQQAAIAGGAAGVLTKDGSIKRLAGVLSDALLRSNDPSADLEVRIGPVASDVVLEWIENTTPIIEAVGSDPTLADVGIAPEIVVTFTRYLDSWRRVAEGSPEFVWAARASAEDIEHMLDAWVRIDAIHVDRLRAIGLDWASPRATAFKGAIASAVLDVLRRKEALESLRERLETQWER